MPVVDERAGKNEEPSAPAPRILTTALLDELLADPLDPGYRAQASRPSRRHWWDGPLVWLGCALVGVLLVTAYQQSHRSAPARDAARKDLVSRIRTLQSLGTSLDDEAKQLGADVNALRDRQLSAGADTSVRSLDIASGGVEVRGPGVTVELSEPGPKASTAASGRPGTADQPQDTVIHDRDVRAVVNQLWASGAEAIAINGIRLTATTAIRFAGESILVDFQAITSPYTISAIGDRDALLVAFADSAVASQLKTTQAVLGIGFKFAGHAQLDLPSVTVAQQTYASPGPAPASTSAQTPTPSESPR
jgi:uncharacterized protein YlxW (UPF0749 family)